MKMKTYDEMEKHLKKQLKPKRFKHTLGVIDCAVDMAERNGADVKKAELAALLHDCAKNYSRDELLSVAGRCRIPLDDITLKEPQLLHGPVGAVVAREEYGVTDSEILDAIAYHTTGREDMTLLDKIIYLADFIEPSRDYPGWTSCGPPVRAKSTMPASWPFPTPSGTSRPFPDSSIPGPSSPGII